MSSWSEIRSRSGDSLSDTLNDLIARANMSEAVKDELTVADQISPIRVMRSKVSVRDNGMMTGYARPFDESTQYFMPLEPDGEKLRLMVKFDSGCDTLPDYSLNGNEVNISFGPTGLPKLLKGTEDDGITAGDMVSQLDGRYHAYRIPVNDRNSIKKMATDGKAGFAFVFRLYFLVLDNMIRSSNGRRATILNVYENDQQTHGLRLEVADDGILYLYWRFNSITYSVKTTGSIITPPPTPDYFSPDYTGEGYVVTADIQEVQKPVTYTDLGFVFNFSTHQILIYRDSQPMTTTSTGVTIIPSGEAAFPAGFADPPPPPPTPVPYVQPFERVYQQIAETADVKINRVTITPQESFYNVENGETFTEAIQMLYNVPVGVPYTPPGTGTEPPPPDEGDRETPQDPIGNIEMDENPDEDDAIVLSQDSSDYESAGNIISGSGTGIGTAILGKAISRIMFYIGCNGTIEGNAYVKVWDENGIEVSQIGWIVGSELDEDNIMVCEIVTPSSNIPIQSDYRFGVEYTEGGDNDELYVYVNTNPDDTSVSAFMFQSGNDIEIDEDLAICCDVYGGVSGSGPGGGGGELLFSNSQNLKEKNSNKKFKKVKMNRPEEQIPKARIIKKKTRTERRKIERDLVKEEKRRAVQLLRDCNGKQQQQQEQKQILKSPTDQKHSLRLTLGAVAPTSQSNVDLGGISATGNSYAILQQASNQNEIVSLQVINTTTGLGNQLNTKVPTAVVMNLSGNSNPTGTATCKMWNGSGNVIATFGQVNVAEISQGGIYDEVVFENLSNTVAIVSGCRIGLEYISGSSSDQVLVKRNPTVTDTSVIQSTKKYGASWATNSSYQPAIHFWTRGTGGGGGGPAGESSVPVVLPSVTNPLIKYRGGPVWDHAVVHFIFSAEWSTRSSPFSRAQLTAKIQAMFPLPYYWDGLLQYGVKRPTLGVIVTNTNENVEWQDNYGFEETADFLYDSIDRGLVPEISDGVQNIYFVIAPPDIEGGYADASGYHHSWFFNTTMTNPTTEGYVMAILGWAPLDGLEFATDTISHEIVETLTSPFYTDDYWGWSSDESPPHDPNQEYEKLIGDWCEPEDYPVINGVTVQTYYSNQDHGCIAPTTKPSWISCPTGYGYDSTTQACVSGGGGGTSTEPPGRRGATAPNGVISAYGTGEYTEDYTEDQASSDSYRWDFEDLGSSRFAWGEELTAYLRTDNPPEDEVTGIMGGGTHGDTPKCYNVGIDTITGETRYRMEEDHPDPIDGEDGGTGVGLLETYVGFRYIKWNQSNGVRLEIWQDRGNNEGSTPANEWELVSSWTETEYNWQDPPSDHQVSLRIDGDNLDEIEVKWLGLREIKTTDTEAGTGGDTPGPGPDPTIQYPYFPITNLPSGNSVMGERFDTGCAILGNAITLVELQVFREPTVTSGTVQAVHFDNGFIEKAILETIPVGNLPATTPSVNTFNLVWQNTDYNQPILPGDSIAVRVVNVLQGSVFVMDNVGNWDGVKNYGVTRAYLVFKANSTGTFYSMPDRDMSGRILKGGGVFYPYLQLNDFRKKIGSQAVQADSKLVGKAVTMVFVTAKAINNPPHDLIYCRIRSMLGAIRATIGQIDTSTILDIDTPLEFINTQNEVTMAQGDIVSIEYDKGTADSYIMISINKGYINSMEGQRTMLAESLITKPETFYTYWGYDLAAIMYTGGKVDLDARPIRGVKLRPGSSLIGRPLTEVRVHLKAVGLFQLGSIIRCKIIRGTDKVTMCILGQYDATSISNDFAVEYSFQNLFNTYQMQAGDMVAIEFNYGDSTNFHILMKTSNTDLFDGQNTVMFEYTGRLYNDVMNVDQSGEMYIGGFTVYPDPQIPPPIPPFHYAHEWMIAAALPEDSSALSNPSEKTAKPFSHCNMVLKEFRLYSIILSQTQLGNYYENRFSISPIPFGKIEITSHDIVPYGN